MKARRYVPTFLVLAVVFLVAYWIGANGCGRSGASPDRTASLPEAPPMGTMEITQRRTVQAHSAKMPIEPQAEPSALPLELTFKTFEVPEEISRPSPPIPENPEK